MLQVALDDVVLGHVLGQFIWCQWVHRCRIKHCQHANRAATETVTIRVFSNQKPWVDRTIHAAVNQPTAAYNAGLLSVNMSEFKASCYALRRALRAAKLRYREIIEFHFQLSGLSTHVAGTEDHIFLWKYILRRGQCRSVSWPTS